jgi:hypothetical protein
VRMRVLRRRRYSVFSAENAVISARLIPESMCWVSKKDCGMCADRSGHHSGAIAVPMRKGPVPGEALGGVGTTAFGSVVAITAISSLADP